MKFESRIFENALQGFLIFLEKLELSITNSAFFKILYSMAEKIYPEKIIDKIDSIKIEKRSTIFTNIFAPEILFMLVYLGYISLSSYRISNTALFSIFLSIVFFIVGRRYSLKEYGEIYLSKSAKKITIAMLFIGFIFLILDIRYAGALPLLNPDVRRRLNVFYTALAQLLPIGAVIAVSFAGKNFDKKKARIYSVFLLFFSLAAISLLGYRTQILVTFLGIIIAMYFTGIITPFEVTFGFIGAAFVLAAASYVRAFAEGSAFSLLEIAGTRIGITMGVYDFIVKRFFPFGADKGYVLLASFSSFIPGLPGPKRGPRTIVATALFDITDVSMTSTILGTVFLDFGIAGIAVFMLVLGYVLGSAYNAALKKDALGIAVYALLLTYSLIGIESGIVDFNVLVLFAASYLVLRKSQ